MGTLDLLFGGGGGGGGGIFSSGTLFLCFVYRCFGFVVLVLVVYSFLVVSHICFCFVFSITCSCRWCLGLVKSIAHRIVFFSMLVSHVLVACVCFRTFLHGVIIAYMCAMLKIEDHFLD